MTIVSNLKRIENAKTAIRTAIIDKGVEVPDVEKLDTYHGYIDQIMSGENVPDAPDLSKVLTKQDFDDIQAIVKAGKASEKFKLGDTFLVTYGSYTMPFEIVGFEDVENEGGSKVPAINLLAKYTSENATAWGSSGTTKYSASTLRSNITTTYQNKLNTDFVNCLANTKTQTYSRDGSTDVVYDKLFAPSITQIGVTNSAYKSTAQSAVEGPVFTAYIGSSNAKRLKQDIGTLSTARDYWTRSYYPSNSFAFSFITDSGTPNNFDSFFSYYIVAACNFIGGTS